MLRPSQMSGILLVQGGDICHGSRLKKVRLFVVIKHGLLLLCPALPSLGERGSGKSFFLLLKPTSLPRSFISRCHSTASECSLPSWSHLGPEPGLEGVAVCIRDGFCTAGTGLSHGPGPRLGMAGTPLFPGWHSPHPAKPPVPGGATIPQDAESSLLGIVL